MNIEELLEKLPIELRTPVAMLNNRVAYLTEENNTLKRKLFARQCEAFREKWSIIVPVEGGIFNEAEQTVLENTEDNTKEKNKTENSNNQERQKSCGRKPLPLDLPREEVIHDLPEEKKFCPNDGTALKKIGEDRVEKLEYIPAQLKVIVEIYPKYACSHCESHVVRDRSVPSVIPGAVCKPGLLAAIILFKYRLGLPLYRIEDMLTGFNIELPRVTLSRWIISAAEFLSPLYQLLKEHLLSKKIIHADESHIQVLNGTGKSPHAKTYMWTLCSGEYDVPIIYYEYHTSRSQEAAGFLLNGYKGFLHVDAYEGYAKITAQPEVTKVSCLAHARRKFFEAEKDGAKNGKSLAGIFLKKINSLFMLERNFKNLSTEERYKERLNHSGPILDDIKKLLDEKIHTVPHKSKIGNAICYTLNNWEGLTAFLLHGDLALSNNRMENFIRPFVIGRKGWLFANTVAGARASAILYSLAITAKENQCDVFGYFRYLFEKLPPLMDDITINELEEFLPWNYQKNIAAKN